MADSIYFDEQQKRISIGFAIDMTLDTNLERLCVEDSASCSGTFFEALDKRDMQELITRLQQMEKLL